MKGSAGLRISTGYLRDSKLHCFELQLSPNKDPTSIKQNSSHLLNSERDWVYSTNEGLIDILFKHTPLMLVDKNRESAHRAAA